MALDNAQFISELSIVDPPGTDPLSQGDDQIRTIKRATQQSFPNIDAAVTLTAVQMNLAAIKNEANNFTASQTITGNLIIDDATDINRTVNWRVSGLNRWQFEQRNSAGNRDFRLRRSDALGAALSTPWTIADATGILDFDHVPTIQGAPVWIAGEIRLFAAAASPGTNWFLANGLNGTVDLQDRALIGTGTSVAGTALTPNLSALLSSGVSGATAISIGQMPSHKHRVLGTGAGQGQAIESSAADGLGAHGPDTTPVLTDTLGGGDPLMETTGSGNSHTHTVATTVAENGTGRNTVRPLSRVVEFHQYVP